MIDSFKKVVYKVFGLDVLSEIDLPEVTSINKQQINEDVIIVKSDLTNLWFELGGKQNQFLVREDLVMFQVPNVAIFLITDGKKIMVSPTEGANEDQIRLYILGSCFGALLIQRKTLPLHGSAVAINGKAYAFIGDSGVGKSTLASAFIKNGYQMLTDDVIALSISKEGTPYVTPAYPQQKLWENSLQAFGMDSKGYLPLFERETKFSVPITTHFHNEPLPLAGVFELSKTEEEEIEISPINPLERLHILYHHTYRNFFVPRLGLMNWHFHTTASFANQIGVFRISRPKTRFTAHELSSLILDTINKGEIKHDYQ